MQLFKTTSIIWTFYKSFILASTAITICCLYFFYQYGFGIFATLFWFKIITLGLIFYYINSYKSKEFYYYQNLGISKTLLWITTFIFDFSLFIFLIIQVYKHQ